MGLEIRGRHGAPLGGDDHGAARQEKARHADRLVEQSAAVALQIEDQRPGLTQFAVRLPEFGHRGLSEAVHLDVAHAVRDPIGRIDRVERNPVAHEREAQPLRNAVAHDLQRDLRAGLAAQVLRHVGAREAHGLRRVDTHDAVVGPHSGAFGRASGDGVHHDDRVAQHVELHADSAELPVDALAHAPHLLGREVGRMGVEPFEHARNGPLDDWSHVLVVHVEFRQVAVHPGEFLQLLHVRPVLRRQRQRTEQGEQSR